ncbi:uncharacterized protein LOC100383698 [Zea mays]|uniref:Uncharacterized protein n=1 Tax=Zea mays TaxID=4577 RepID=C0PIE5_MAIZE|nr:uncharacterized protein LOC100383698 [Zea mays]ACN34961.1 unknown [Zea mays]|eukprot:NP_001169806.1 uncharacterized protein LOC100383698 [Zea mays]
MVLCAPSSTSVPPARRSSSPSSPLRACFLRVLAGRTSLSLARSPMPHAAELALRVHLLLLQLPRTLRSVATRAPAPASMTGRELQLGRSRCSPTLAAVPLSLLARVDVPSARSCPSSQLPARVKLSARRRFSPARSVPARQRALSDRSALIAITSEVLICLPARRQTWVPCSAFRASASPWCYRLAVIHWWSTSPHVQIVNPMHHLLAKWETNSSLPAPVVHYQLQHVGHARRVSKLAIKFCFRSRAAHTHLCLLAVHLTPLF